MKNLPEVLSVLLFFAGLVQTTDGQPLRSGSPSSSALVKSPTVILHGDFPDPSIVRDGNDYYLTNSAYDYVPGLLIWHSGDLLHWKPICHALQHRVGEIWAPDFVKYNGVFYIYFPANGTNYVITATTPYGPWSEPIDLKIGGIDPGHVATPDGKRFLYVNDGRMVPLSPDGLSVVDTLRHVYDGWNYPDGWAVECFCLESPKLTYRNGYYYLTSAEGGTSGPSTSHMVVSARSRSPLGPWENSPYNPIVHTWDGLEPWWSKGHGTLVDDPQGNWYIVYHAYENGHRNFGRCVLVEPIVWTADGWFTAAEDNRSAPIPPIIRNHSIESDDFTGAGLKPQWQFSGLEVTSGYILHDSTLTFAPTGGKLAVLLSIGADHNFEASVFVAPEDSVEAGIVAYYGPTMFTGIGTRAGHVIQVSRSTSWDADPVVAGCHWFKLSIVNDNLSVYCSMDGSGWRKLPESMDVSVLQTNAFGNFSSIHLGIYARGHGSVHVRHFRYKTLDQNRPTHMD